MAACLEDAAEGITRVEALKIGVEAIGVVCTIRNWQRAKLNVARQDAMQIEDDKTLDELEQIEHETRLAARAACEAVGIDWRTLGDVA